MIHKTTFFALAAVLGLALTANAAQGIKYTPGDVFVAVGAGHVIEFTPAGAQVQTLDCLTGSTYTTGMAFDTKGNLYVTNFSIGTVSEFDINGNCTNASFITGQVNPESDSMPGGLFPALIGDAGQNLINEYDGTGTLLHSFVVQIENRGTDWVDLQPDLCTVLYTSEGSSILSYNICTQTQNAPFATGLTGPLYAHRTLSSGPFAGDDLVADSANALLVAPGGAIVMTYNLPGNSGEDFALNLSQDGKSFWTADLASGEVWQVDIATGNILNQWNSGFPSTTAGLAVFQEKGQGVGPCAIPIPACK